MSLQVSFRSNGVVQGPTTIDALLRVTIWTISEMRAALGNDTQLPQ